MVVTWPFHQSLPHNIMSQMATIPRLMHEFNAVAELNCNPVGCFWPNWTRVIIVHDLYFRGDTLNIFRSVIGYGGTSSFPLHSARQRGSYAYRIPPERICDGIIRDNSIRPPSFRTQILFSVRFTPPVKQPIRQASKTALHTPFSLETSHRIRIPPVSLTH